MRHILMIGCLLATGFAQAAPMTDVEFKKQAKVYYDSLELKMTALDQAVSSMQHPTVMVARACDYSKGLKTFKQFSADNLHLAQAKDELQFISQLDEHFNNSLKDLGTSYEKGCVSKSST